MATECTTALTNSQTSLGSSVVSGQPGIDEERTGSLGEKDCDCKGGRLRHATTDRNDIVGSGDQKWPSGKAIRTAVTGDRSDN